MNIAMIRMIDRWVGMPVCWVLTLWERLVSRWRRTPPVTPKHLLCIELSEMGSAIIAYTALQKLQAMYPDAALYFLIFAENQESIALINVIPPEHIFTIRHQTPGAFAADTLAVLQKLRALPLDTLLDLELFSRASSILAYLSGARRRVGFYQFRQEGLYRGDFLTHKVQYNMYQHMAYNFLNLVYALQADAAEIPKLKRRLTDTPTVPRLVSTAAEQARMWAKLTALQPKLTSADTLIVLNPNAGLLPIRAWPLAKYVALAQELVQTDGVYLVVMGVKGAAADAAVIAAAIGERCLDLTNKTATLREVIDLFNLAAALVTNDSGPAHFASLTPIKNFVFFGPETPDLYAPLGANTFPIFARYSCSPCLNAFNHRNTPCTDPQCVQHIAVAEVARLIRAECQLSAPSNLGKTA